MKFDFHIAGAAYNNSDSAQLRESTRMACLAHGLGQIGHDVRVIDPGAPLLSSPRWYAFEHLAGFGRCDALQVLPAESLRHGGTCDVAVKCSVSCKYDDLFLLRSRLLVAHECDERFVDDSRVLHVPFLIHDRVLGDMVERQEFGCYLADDLAMVREHAGRDPVKWMGFCGYGWGFRKEFLHVAPEWVEVQFYDTHPLGGWEHACWMSKFRAGLVLRGDTPKVNLTPLLMLLGVVVVAPEAERNTPPLTDESMIRFTGDWDLLKRTLEDEQRIAQIVANADAVYRDGWSPIGQARQIVEALERLA